MVIAVAGKGGAGKTTIATLIIGVLLSQNKKPILAVDADPNSTLGDYLGIRHQHTISDIIEETKGLRNLPDGVSKPTYLEYQLQRAITETKGVDLLVMGRPEGPECYCMANNILRGYLQKISSNYPYVVIDNEAGMEHLSRKTTQNIDAMILVSDSTKAGLQSAKRIKELIDKLTFLNIKNKYLLVNGIKGQFSPCPQGLGDKEIERLIGVKLFGVLPYNDEIARLSINGGPIVNLAKESAIVKSIEEIVTKIVNTN